MDKQKEIKNIGNIIFDNIKIPVSHTENLEQIIPITLADKAAEKIIEAGYGDTKEAIKEFAEKAIAMGRITFAPNNGKEYLEIALEKFENLVKEICENEV